MDRFDYIESIILFLNGVTGINYQLQLRKVLCAFYKYKGKNYEMPDFYGGDDKNDGWVVDDAVFYQIFAPTRLKQSLRKEIQQKFKDDLEGLLDIIYVQKKWDGEIKEFIFIVNTIDNELPSDSDRFFEKTVDDLKLEHGIDFNYKVSNTEYIRDIISEIQDVDVLKSISSDLRVRHLIDYNAITETMIIDLINQISGNLHTKALDDNHNTTYKRISSIKKIVINKLDSRKEEIEKIITKLDVVEHAVNTINQDILCENKFERVKDLIIEKYEELSKDIDGVELYDCLLDRVLKYTDDQNAIMIPTKFLIIYIFDKCDIFEKE